MSSPADSPPAPRRSRTWVGFFVLLLGLAGVAVALPIVYNLAQQLRPESLARARQRWRERGPADYDLTFAITYDRERLSERHIVLVRNGKVLFASCEGDVVHLAHGLGAAAGLPAGGLGKAAGLDVPAIFDHIEELLREQIASGGRNYLVAEFDPDLGYPRRFVRRVRGTGTREEWRLKLWAPGTVASGSYR
jgi:hypothetical protein